MIVRYSYGCKVKNTPEWLLERSSGAVWRGVEGWGGVYINFVLGTLRNGVSTSIDRL
ncbi:hypothetical protein MHB77_07980 [Paenibacillus sp. FSL K6-3166]|uniref:hypothetical protein n=1 Tax=Paenibacillus sp. FSL K6-3166 TaxID=2921492 RepID=UPI0030F87A33